MSNAIKKETLSILDTNAAIKGFYDTFVNIDSKLSKGIKVEDKEYGDLYNAIAAIKNNKQDTIKVDELKNELKNLLKIESGSINKFYNACKFSSTSILSQDDQKQCTEQTGTFLDDSNVIFRKYNALYTALSLVGTTTDIQSINQPLIDGFVKIKKIENDKIFQSYLDETQKAMSDYAGRISTMSSADDTKQYLKLYSEIGFSKLLPFIFSNNSTIDQKTGNIIYSDSADSANSVVNNKNYLKISGMIVFATTVINSIDCKNINKNDINDKCVKAYIKAISTPDESIHTIIRGVFNKIHTEFTSYMKNHTYIIPTGTTNIIITSLGDDVFNPSKALNDIYNKKNGTGITCTLAHREDGVTHAHERKCYLTQTPTKKMIVNNGDRLEYFHEEDNRWVNYKNQVVDKKTIDSYKEKFFVEEVPFSDVTISPHNDHSASSGFSNIMIPTIGACVLIGAFLFLS